MKSFKKLILRLLVVGTVLSGLLAMHGNASAAPIGFTPTQVQNARIYFVNSKQLDVLINGHDIEFDGSVNGDTGEGIYTPKDSSLFCSPPNTQGNQTVVYIATGANFNPDDTRTLSGSVETSGFGGGSDTTTLIYSGANTQNCAPQIPSNRTVTLKPGTTTDAMFTDQTIKNIGTGNFVINDGANITFTFNNTAIAFYDKDATDNIRNFAPKTSADSAYFCSSIGGITFNNNDQDNDPLAATFNIAYVDTSNGNQCKKTTLNINLSNPNKIATQVLQWNGDSIDGVSGGLTFNAQQGSQTTYLKDTSSNCGGGWAVQLDSAQANTGNLYQVADSANGDAGSIGLPQCKITSQRDVLIDGTAGIASSNGSGSFNNDASCEGNSGGTALAWMVCPLLDAATNLNNKLIGLFEGQLSFRVSELGGVSGADNGPNPVHASWSLIRDIASSLLVILMLIMVLSQALSFGPFDAYTIKKVLPKLVIATILMQVSWGLFALVVNIFDDIGHGLANILYLPFGGAGHMDLWHLLQNGGLTGGEVGVLNWAAIPLVAFLGFAFVFTMLGLATTAIIALLAGLFTLVFRKTLIIMLLILSPIALIAWILPGTQTYWKMWRENFIKSLSMYPLAVGLIAAGRIFAEVSGNQNQSSGGTFLNLIFIMVGYFGPLFILPKTFKWGGQAMQMAGNGIAKAGQKINERPKKFFDKNQEAWNHIRSERSADRYAHPEKYKNEHGRYRLSSYWNRPLDRIKAGDYNPLLGVSGSQVRSKQRNRVLAEAEKAEAESRSENLQRIQKTVEERLQEGAETDSTGRALAQKGGNKDDMYQDMLRLARGEEALKKYYDYEGKEIDLKKVMGNSHAQVEASRRAALDRMIQLGADTNWSHIDAEDERIRNNGTAEEKAEWRKFLNDNKDQVLEKMPDLLKGTGSVSDISAEGLAKMHGAGIKRMLSKLNAEATDPDKKISPRTGVMETDAEYEERIKQAQARLTKFLSTAQEAITNSNTRGLMEQGGLRAIKAFVTPDDQVRKYLLDEDPYKMHSDSEDGRKSIREYTTIDPATGRVTYSGDLLLKPIIDADANGHVSDTPDPATGYVASRARDALPKKLVAELDSIINPNGSFDNGALKQISEAQAAPTPLRPGVVKIQHQETVSRTMPSDAVLGTDPAVREAFKFQIMNNPQIVQNLAQAIAYNVAEPQHIGVLAEMKQQAEDVISDPTSTDQQKDEARKAWNNIANQIQQAFQQKMENEAASMVQSGVDPAQARDLATTTPDRDTGLTDAEQIANHIPTGAAPLRRL